MNRNFAFRLCGELAETGSSLYYSVSTGNLALTCINAGIELINLGSSIISWNAERNRTKIMQQSLADSVKKLDKLKKIKQETVEASLEKAKEDMQQRLELLRIELEKNRFTLMNEIESRTAKLNQDMELHFSNMEIIKTIRLKVKETIDLVTKLLEEQNSNSQQNIALVTELQEQLRIAVAQYTKFVNICC